MKHVKALLIKFIMVTAVLFVIMRSFGEADFGDILLTSIIVTGAAYLIGDLFILPKFGNTVATIADIGLAFFKILICISLFVEGPLPAVTVSLLSAALIGVGEWFFHKYLNNQVLNDNQETKNNNRQTNVHSDALAAEFASETDAQEIEKRNQTNKQE